MVRRVGEIRFPSPLPEVTAGACGPRREAVSWHRMHAVEGCGEALPPPHTPLPRPQQRDCGVAPGLLAPPRAGNDGFVEGPRLSTLPCRKATASLL
jgi:hypothetical protein